MRSTVLILVLALAALLPPAAAAAVTIRTPVDDVGFPFWCDWGYDWDERCYTDTGSRLPVGGVDDKVWRSGLRFSLAGIPTGTTIGYARLELYFDAVCVAPRLRAMACPPTEYAVHAHRILTADWYHEREPAFDPQVEDETFVEGTAAPHWLTLDLSALVRDWITGEARNDGVLVSLADWQEDYGVSGPYVPSMSFPTSGLRPRLVIGYVSPTGAAP